MKEIKDLFGFPVKQTLILNNLEKYKESIKYIPENKLHIVNKGKKITISWFVGRPSNFDDLLKYDYEGIDGQDYLDLIRDDLIGFRNDELLIYMFWWGLIMQPLVKINETKTPTKYKKYFHDHNSIQENEDINFCLDNRHLDRLKIFGPARNCELDSEKKHMDEFYSLWSSFKFGKWKIEVLVKENFDSGIPPFRINFEWMLPDFLEFNRFQIESDDEDLFYLATEMSDHGVIGSFFNY